MPQHNGVAKLLNHRLMEHVHALLYSSGLPKFLWGEAIHFAVWLKNHTSTHALSNVTPYKHLHREKPNLAGLPEWGQHVWVHQMTDSKLDARAIEGQWVGFDHDSTHAHRIYWPGKNTVGIECDVKFTPASTTVTLSLPSGSELSNAPSQPSAILSSPSTASQLV
jgi:hypothetical protein